jgi:predicted nucleic acid-binding protein
VINSEQCVANHFLLELDKGEKYTLNMALKMSANMVIMDEKIGRNIAEYLGLTVIGTLGILLNAKRRGLIICKQDYC